MTVRARIIAIGNSQGIRIPKLLLEQTGIREQVELEVRKDKIIIHALYQPRKEWDAAFKEMAAQKDDELLDEDVETSEWDQEDWEW